MRNLIAFIKQKWLALAGWVLSLIAVFPFIALCRYIHPNAEDYGLSYFPRDNGIWASMVDLYTTYDGRFFVNFLSGINPLVFNSITGYKLTPIVLLALLFFGLYLLIRKLTGSAFARAQQLLIAAIFLALYLTTLQSVPHQLYWQMSSFVYFIPTILSVFLIMSLLRIYELQDRKLLLTRTIGGSLFAAALAGCNAMCLPLVILITFTPFALAIVGNSRNKLLYGYIFSIACMGCIVFMLAPGINLRMDETFVHEVERDFDYWVNYVAHQSITHFYWSLWRWLIENPLPILTGFLFLIIFPRSKVSLTTLYHPFRLHPLLFFLLHGIFMLLIVAPFYYGMGREADWNYPARIYNMVSFYFLLGLFLNLPNMSRWMYKQIPLPNQKITNGIALLLILAGAYFTVQNDNVNRAYASLLDGSAQTYHQKHLERYAEIRKQQHKEAFQSRIAIVDSIATLPRILFQGPEITSNSHLRHWNRDYEKYFNIYEIRYHYDTLSKKEYLNQLRQPPDSTDQK